MAPCLFFFFFFLCLGPPLISSPHLTNLTTIDCLNPNLISPSCFSSSCSSLLPVPCPHHLLPPASVNWPSRGDSIEIRGTWLVHFRTAQHLPSLRSRRFKFLQLGFSLAQSAQFFVADACHIHHKSPSALVYISVRLLCVCLCGIDSSAWRSVALRCLQTRLGACDKLGQRAPLFI